jgi:hypothetical protein
MKPGRSGHHHAKLALICSAALVQASLIQGCVTYRPTPIDQMDFMERAVTQEQDGVSVTVAALGRKEAEQAMGINVSAKGIQPVWLEIDNRTANEQFAFFQQSVDPEYFAPSEVAYINHYSPLKRLVSLGAVGLLFPPLWVAIPFQLVSAPIANKRMDKHIGNSGIGNLRVEPGTRHSGFVFTNLDEGTKHIDVTLMSPDQPRQFDLFAQVPGVRADHGPLETMIEKLQSGETQPPTEAVDNWLDDLPCCTTNKTSEKNGDPLNLVIIASFDELLNTFARAGWDETEVISLATSLKTARSAVLGSEYRYSPVSNLYLFGRPQDIAFQKARGTVHERNHLRLWLSPLLHDGKPVWVGQVSRDIGVKFTLKTWNLTTHAIDSDIDDSREATMGDLLQTGHVARIGYIPGVGRTDPSKPPRNLTGDEYFTDGFRALSELSNEPVQPQFLNQIGSNPAQVQ